MKFVISLVIFVAAFVPLRHLFRWLLHRNKKNGN